MKIWLTCERCAKEFQSQESAKRRYCSAACYNATASDLMLAGLRAHPTSPRKGDELPCVICGTVFYRTPAMIKRNRKTCSKPCSDRALIRPPVIKACARCGKELRLKPSQAAIQYCSKQCEAAARTKRPIDRMHNGKLAKKDHYGYVMIYEPNHPNKSFGGFVYEHRHVVEQAFGRYLASDEQVHHINGVKDDNRIDNLQVLSEREHRLITVREYQEQLKRDRAELAAYRARYGPLEGKE